MRSFGPLLVGLWARETRACAGEVAWRRSAPHGMLGADLAIARRSRARPPRPPRTPRPPGDATGRSGRPVRRGARAGPGRHGDRIPRRGREAPPPGRDQGAASEPAAAPRRRPFLARDQNRPPPPPPPIPPPLQSRPAG